MIYKQFKDLKLSALGLGAMRFPVIDGKSGQIDEEATEKIVDKAIEKGINYFDTAWMYHEFNSEVVIGKLLKKYPRESYFLATKFPGLHFASQGKPEEIFEKQLEKCQVDYFDFYLIHNLNDNNIENYMDENDPVIPYLLEQKEKGRIRHFGLSTHASLKTLTRFLDKWGEHVEFCQIQLNYIDWDLQHACDKVTLLNERNIPIWVMEPLRGGKLATLSEKNTTKLRVLRPDEDIPAWGFRFLQSVPGVTMVLSGMSSEEQLLDNIHTFETDQPLNEEETAELQGIAKEMSGGIPCTACNYCTIRCPLELNIPKLIELYNEFNFSGGGLWSISSMPEEKRPAACIGCRSCEAMCPQSIRISEVMADFAAKLSEKQDKS